MRADRGMEAPFSCWSCFFSYSPRYHWLSGLQAHIASSCHHLNCLPISVCN
ncbi:hypothetical protein Nmel_011011 [Mimus melanotis]